MLRILPHTITKESDIKNNKNRLNLIELLNRKHILLNILCINSKNVDRTKLIPYKKTSTKVIIEKNQVEYDNISDK